MTTRMHNVSIGYADVSVNGKDVGHVEIGRPPVTSLDAKDTVPAPAHVWWAVPTSREAQSDPALGGCSWHHTRAEAVAALAGEDN